MILTRRSFLGNLFASLVAAPAIVRPTSLMPVRAILRNPVAMISLHTLDGSQHWLDLFDEGGAERLVRKWLAANGQSDARWTVSPQPNIRHEYGVIGDSWKSRNLDGLKGVGANGFHSRSNFLHHPT